MTTRAYPWEAKCVLQVNAVECSRKNTEVNKLKMSHFCPTMVFLETFFKLPVNKLKQNQQILKVSTLM